MSKRIQIVVPDHINREEDAKRAEEAMLDLQTGVATAIAQRADAVSGEQDQGTDAEVADMEGEAGTPPPREARLSDPANEEPIPLPIIPWWGRLFSRRMQRSLFPDQRLAVEMLAWRVLLQPLAPPKREGQIIVLDEYQKAQEYLTTIAEVIDVGPAAFKGKTASGVSLKSSRVYPGEWVQFEKFTGRYVMLQTGHKLLIVDDTDIVCRVPDPYKLVVK